LIAGCKQPIQNCRQYAAEEVKLEAKTIQVCVKEETTTELEYSPIYVGVCPTENWCYVDKTTCVKSETRPNPKYNPEKYKKDVEVKVLWCENYNKRFKANK